MTRRIALVLVAVLLLLGHPAALVSVARLTASGSVSANALSTKSWYFLHNSPTPPTGNTTAVNNLSMDTITPTQATLFNYDTGADSLAGRRLLKSGTGPGDATLTRYANWRSASFASSRTISGTVVLRIWCGITGFPLAQQGSLVVYLRDFNPTTSTYVEIANATLVDANWQAGSSTWVQKRINVAVASYTLAAGHRLEVKVETTAAASANMVIAYDMTGYPSSLSVP
jgi:hypothetical protein